MWCFLPGEVSIGLFLFTCKQGSLVSILLIQSEINYDMYFNNYLQTEITVLLLYLR